jgi:hypothetical protein
MDPRLCPEYNAIFLTPTVACTTLDLCAHALLVTQYLLGEDEDPSLRTQQALARLKEAQEKIREALVLLEPDRTLPKGD